MDSLACKDLVRKELVRKLKVQAERKGGFRLRKWLSNKKQLLERMEQSEEREHAKEMFQMIKHIPTSKVSMGINNNSDTSEKVLGMGWIVDQINLYSVYRKVSRKSQVSSCD